MDFPELLYCRNTGLETAFQNQFAPSCDSLEGHTKALLHSFQLSTFQYFFNVF